MAEAAFIKSKQLEPLVVGKELCDLMERLPKPYRNRLLKFARANDMDGMIAELNTIIEEWESLKTK